MKEIEKKVAKDYFDRWPKCTVPLSSKVCDVLVKFKNGRFEFYKNQVCHAMMLNVQGREIERVYSSLWCVDNLPVEAAQEYWGFLLDKELSPFKSVIQDVEVVYSKYGIPIAFGVSNGHPNQLTVGLMIAARATFEYPGIVLAFSRCREEGLEPFDAFFIAQHFTYRDGLFSKFSGESHCCFSAPYNGGLNYKNMKEGTPARINKGYYWDKGSSQYNPTNSIWSIDQQYSPPIEPPLWKALCKNRVYEGAFPVVFKAKFGKLEFTTTFSVAEEVFFKGLAELDKKVWRTGV